MSTYIMTWNPKKWDWSDPEDYDRWVRDAAKGRCPGMRWSCGNTMGITKGDRVFLLRQGSDRPGLVASGFVTRGSYLGRSWNSSSKGDRPSVYVQADWDVVLPLDHRLPRETLLRGIMPARLVNSQVSGVQLPAPEALVLERSWSRHTGTRLSIVALGGASAIEGASVHGETFRRRRDRRLRDEALNRSRGICAVCDRDFTKVLDGAGTRVLEVHHRRQLSLNSGPVVTRVEDLAVVCANCHALLHLDPRRATKVEVLRARLRRSRRSRN